MSIPNTSQESFFISYTGKDSAWAEWIAWVIEDAGYKTVIQAWDFKAAQNFVLRMQDGTANTDRTVAVLTPDYFKSAFTKPEWAAAFASDPTSEQGKLIPIRVVDFKPQGLFNAIVYIDLVGLDETAAEKKLSATIENIVKGTRGKPATKPKFPQSAGVQKPAFPGLAEGKKGSVHNLPFRSNPYFTGRKEALDKLHKNLACQSTAAITQPQAVHGLGGVGKTQLAVEYAWRNRASYDAVLWVGADSPENLDANLAALCRSEMLDLPEAEAKEQPVQTSAVLRWLHQHPRWLLILDSADSREAATAVRKLLEAPLLGHVIVTSRRSDWPLEVRPLEVDSLPEDVAADFLLARTEAAGFHPGPCADAKDLSRELGGLPLALEQAAAYILRHRVTFTDYIGRLQAIRPHLLKEESAGATRYPRSVAETWLTTEKELGLTARAILRLAAFLAPDDIPRLLVDDKSKALAAAVYTLAEEEKVKPSRSLVSETALVELADHSMITLEPKVFSCHNLVQAVQSDRLTDELRCNWVELAALWVSEYVPSEPPPSDIRSWPVMESLRAHIEAVVIHADRLAITEPTGLLMSGLGAFLFAKTLYREAEPLMHRALIMCEKSLGQEHPSVGILLNNFAQLLQNTNRQKEAEPMMRQGIVIFEKNLGENHPNVAVSLGTLAGLLRNTNRPKEAELLIRRALKIWESNLDTEHHNYAACLNNLAQLLMEAHQLEEAEKLIRSVIEIDKRSLGENHPYVATTFINLASLLRDTNRLSEAEPLIRRALEIDEKSYGPEHPDVAIDLNNLAQLLKDTNRLSEAEPLMRRHVIIFRKFVESTGYEHPYMQKAIRNYTALLKAMKLPKKEIQKRVKEAAGKYANSE